MRQSNFGQSVLEYALIVGVVVAALSAMSIYVQRSIQANLRVIEDQVNTGPTTVSTSSNETTTTGGANAGPSEPQGPAGPPTETGGGVGSGGGAGA